MRIRPLDLRPQFGDGSSNLGGGTAANALGRLGCIPYTMFTVPSPERWKIEAIHLTNWGDRDGIYSITVEKAGYSRAAVLTTAPGLRNTGAFDTTGSTTIAWGELLGAGQRERIAGPFWLYATEVLAGASIPGLGVGMINCHITGWAFS